MNLIPSLPTPPFVCSCWAFRWDVALLGQQSAQEHHLVLSTGPRRGVWWWFVSDSHSVHAQSEKLSHCKLTLLLITSGINLVLFCVRIKTCSCNFSVEFCQVFLDLIKILLAHVLEWYFSHVGVTVLLSTLLICFAAQITI